MVANGNGAASKMDVQADVVVVGMPAAEGDDDWAKGWVERGMSAGNATTEKEDLAWHRQLVSRIMDLEEHVGEALEATGEVLPHRSTKKI
jgi:hypothetical protein